ncbi:tripartite motif-containing protein 72 isoform X1 [Drosophila takahashii]|uniref:tripartite motif-containing protein 72 isoform X1 n=1 Tax=Drosophila takahashii TaxID=29030 RepID=UPI0038990D63
MELPIQVPKELESLLSCGLCRRPYDLATGLLPRELLCQHNFCDECVSRSTVPDSAECICPLCGVCTHLSGQKLPEAVGIMYLLRELPALVLGRAMLDFSKRNAEESSSGEATTAEESPSENWLDEICVESFLVSGSEHCFIHAMPNSTWCHNCQRLLCRACSDVPMHREHRMVRQLDYQDLLRQLLSSELAKVKCAALQTTELAAREMDLFRDLSEACFQVQLHVKRVMLEHQPSLVAAMMMGWQRRAELDLNRAAGSLTGADMMQLLGQLAKQRRRFEGQLMEVHFHCRMRAAVQENGMQVLDFDHLNDRILKLRSNPRPGAIPANVEPPRALILTNYCVFAYWNEVQRQLIPPQARTPPPEVELLPQSRRAVVPPHFTHYQREVEARMYMQQVERDQNQALNRLAEDGSSSSPSSSSNSIATDPQQQQQQIHTYVLDMDHHRMVQQYRQMEWQAQQQQWQQQQQHQLDASWVNWEQNQDYQYQDGASSSSPQANWPAGY